MGEEMITEMRETPARHARVPFGVQQCQQLFADHPAEADELLTVLYDECDAGNTNLEPDIRALIRLQRGALGYVYDKRTAAIRRMGVLRAAYLFPPICELSMYLSLRGVVHAGDEHEFCEALVCEHLGVAQALLAQLGVAQRREHLHDLRSGAWHNIAGEIDTLRAMIARATLRDTLRGMDGDAA